MACYSPMNLKIRNKITRIQKYQSIPCGKCVGCLLERSRQWAIRCEHERQTSSEACFITLTYAPKHLVRNDNNVPTLYPRDLQLFIKKLRKHFEPTKIRFFACGEYGGETYRPHYHALLFGIDFLNRHLYTKENKELLTFYKTNPNGDSLYHSSILNRIWGLGDCLIGNATFESAAYVARYIVDKKYGPAAGYYRENLIEPEFVRMSRRPGIGHEWFKKYQSDVFPKDTIIIRGGIKSHPPKYYTKIYEIKEPLKYQKLHLQRVIKQQENLSENTLTRLATKKQIKIKQIESLQRKF